MKTQKLAKNIYDNHDDTKLGKAGLLVIEQTQLQEDSAGVLHARNVAFSAVDGSGKINTGMEKTYRGKELAAPVKKRKRLKLET